MKIWIVFKQIFFLVCVRAISTTANFLQLHFKVINIIGHLVEQLSFLEQLCVFAFCHVHELMKQSSF